MGRSVRWLPVVCASVALSCASCSSAPPADPQAENAVGETSKNETGPTIEVTDNYGSKTVPLKPDRVHALDPRMAELLSEFGVASSSDDPQLVIAGAGEVLSDVEADYPDAVILDFSPRANVPLDWELVRQAQVLGIIFDDEDRAKQLDDDFSAALRRALAAKQDEWGAVVADTESGAVLPPSIDSKGLLQPMLIMLDIKMAVPWEPEGQNRPWGPDEFRSALAASDPDVAFLRDADSSMNVSGYVPPQKAFLGDSRFGETKAARNVNVYVVPTGSPETVSVATYTLMLNELADQWSSTS